MNVRPRRQAGPGHGLCVVAGALLAGLTASGATLAAGEIDLTIAPITRFHMTSAETRFGALEFVGGFSMRSRSADFGQLSSFRFVTPGGDLVGVADHGFWFFGTIERDADHVPTAISRLRMQAMAEDADRSDAVKYRVDAEGLSVEGDVATVVFERGHRATEYKLSDDGILPLRDLDFVIPRHELRFNQGMETVARAPDEGHLAGARVIIAERSIDANGDIFAAIVDGPQRGVFKVTRSEGYDVTDGVFLPDGDLLLLERRFQPSLGISMRLRRIDGSTVVRGGRIDGAVLMEANLAYQIDNMEAVDAWTRADGATIVSLMSDNNQSFIQRSLYLEFVLIDE